MLRGISTNLRDKRSIAYAVIASAAFSFIALFLAPTFLPSSSFAEEPITVNPNLTIGGSGSLSLTVNPGQFGSASQDITVTTSNYTGYTMTIAPTSGNTTELVNSNVSSITLPSISESLSASDFSSLPTAAYGLSIDEGTNYIPVENDTTIKTTSGPTNATTGTFNLTLGAKTLTDTPAGSYTKSFMLTATANPATWSITYDKNADTDTVNLLPASNEATVSGTALTLSGKTPTRAAYKFLHWNTSADDTGDSYPVSGTINLNQETPNHITLYAIWGCGDGYICYNDNGADEVDGGKGTMKHTTLQSSTYSAGSSQTLIAPNYSKTGYGFVGWSTEPIDPTKSTTAIKTDIASLATQGKIYGPNQTITMPSPQAPVELYAVWLRAETELVNNVETPVYLQGWTGCSSMSDGDIIALTDSRDNNIYAVAKIEKNKGESNEYSKCWLIENLRLDVATASITDTNTNHPTANFKQEAAALTSAFWDTCTTGDSACFDHISYNLANINRTNTASHNANNQTSSWYSYGSMYNWYTATAGNGTYSKSSGNTEGSLCPSGWNLPSGKDANGDFGKLDLALGGTGANQSTAAASNRWRTYPVNFLYTGYFNTSADRRGSFGYCWSSTAYYNYTAYYFNLGSSSVDPGPLDYSKRFGQAVRCLAGTSETFTLTYDANGGSGAPSSQTSSSTANGIYTFTLSPTAPTRSGYTFAGWMDEDGTEISATDAATGTYQYTATRANTTLYARWENNDCNSSASTIGTGNSTDAVCLQDMNATVRASMTSKQTYNLKDARDNKSYTVALLDDGEVWMTQNLNYGGASATLLTPYDTDLASGTTFVAPASSSTFSTGSSYYTTPQLQSDVTTYGGYYSFAAAIANTSTYSTTNQNITTSICPSGWDLPTSSQYTSLKSSASLTNYATASAAPYSFTYGGYKNGSSFSSQTTRGDLWTSTNQSASYAQEYYITSSSFTLGNGNSSTYYKYYGRNVRCIAGNGTLTVHYDANGGSGTMSNQTGEINSLTASANNFTGATDHKQFRNWNTKADGSGVTVATGGSITAAAHAENVTSGGTLTLYAQWDDVYVMTFVNTNGGATQTKKVVVGQSTTVSPSSSFYRSGYKLIGWDSVTNDASATAGTVVYTNGQSITPSSDMTFYTVWRPAYRIVYHANGSTDGTMDNHTNVAEGDSLTLYASNFARANYGFAGWSLTQVDPDSANALATINSLGSQGLIYGPNATITAPSFATYGTVVNNVNTIYLYAVWVPKDTTYNLQTFSANNRCSTMSEGEVIALQDSRDTNVYTVAKLKDGNCWMVENLRLNPADPNTSITAANTNNPTSTFINTDITLANIQESTGKKAYTNPYFRTCTDTDNTNGPLCMDQISFLLGNISGATSSRTASSQSSRWYSYGVMYNWYTATAGHGTYSKSSGTTDGDICPTGWHLPYGGSSTGTKGGNTSGGYYYLNYKLNNNTNVTNVTASSNRRKYPNNFLYSGGFYGTSTYNRGSYGIYWSSTAYGRDYAYGFDFSSSSVGQGTSGSSKYHGQSVRCLASPHYNLTLTLGTGVASVEVDGVTYSSSTTLSLAKNSTHTINMTFASGYEFDSWSVSGTGSSVASTSTQSTTLTMGSAASTLTANAKQSIVYMQNWTGCNSLSPNETITLVDSRDGTAYTVARLVDDVNNPTYSKCWMTQNMRLDFSSSTLTNQSVADLEAATNNPASGFWTAAKGAAASNSNFDSSHYDVVNYSKINIGDTTTDPTNHTYDEYGIYYNWYTATAGHGTQSKSSGDTDGDICPSGWHLPTGKTGGEFQALNNAINGGSDSSGSGLLASPANFLYSGAFSNSGVTRRGTGGGYWSSTATNSSDAYLLLIDAPLVSPGLLTTYKYVGQPIRCIENSYYGPQPPMPNAG